MTQTRLPGVAAKTAPVPVLLAYLSVLTGCAVQQMPLLSELTVRDAVERYSAEQGEQLAQFARQDDGRALAWRAACSENAADVHYAGPFASAAPPGYPTLGTLGWFDQNVPQSQPAAATRPGDPPPGYWRKDVWHQMGHESLALAKRDFWHGFKTSFWDLENALALTATMGASIAIRETGVDGTIRNRVHGHRQLGDFDESIQLLGHPGVHFAGTGVLWLTSTLTRDMKQHELAKSLTQALAVNGVTTLALKAMANTRAPDNEPHAWPSGHTSSAFTVAAVLNEHYGPWVGVPSLALAGLVGYQRLDSRVHDFSDVVFGAMLGYIVGTSVARDEKARFPEIFGMQVLPFTDPETGASGLALMKRF
ncbi:MAG: phosphatase PAP2 family protein [Planctomycetes bacterium]|nr:phosphatase PAP2 family protein [Planctomycetota bacterium]